MPDVAWIRSVSLITVSRFGRALTWSNDLQASAQSWANTCNFSHSQAGENLAAGTGNFNAAAAVKAWTDEASSYDPSNPQPSHWTQGL